MRFFRNILIAVLSTAFFMSASAQTLETDPLVKAMQEELQFNMEQLMAKPVPAYFMSLRMNDLYSASITSNFGVESVFDYRQRTITPHIRVGSPEVDNFKYETQTRDMNSWNRMEGVAVPYTDNSIMAVRQGIWNKTMDQYNKAVSLYHATLSQMKTNADNEDKAPCFSDAPVEKDYEEPYPDSFYQFDLKEWSERLNKVSSVFKECKFIETGAAIIEYSVERTYVVNTDGSAVVQNRRAVRLMLQAAIRATDGMTCPLYKDWFAFAPEEMPDEETLMTAVRDMVDRLLALRDAPLADPYSGPAIMAGEASGVFFHEIFGHRLEAHRMKRGGQTFKKLVGEAVLPSDFQVFDDPTLKTYAGTPLNGHYKYDDEAVKAQRVQCVEDGVLKNFLVGRVPIEGFPASNGHGRAFQGYDPVSRQSNLIIETKKPYSDEELRQMLVDAVKKEGKEYGYYFRTATSGMTYTGEGGSINSFGVDPVEVYKVFVDGRPDQLVRGVTLIGTPLAMFSGIAAGGKTPSVFTGSCGAESGWVPVTAVSPMIFVSKIETQRSETGYDLPQLLEQPEYKDVSGDDATVIFTAMKDEMARSMTNLKAEGLEAPIYMDYQIWSSRKLHVNSSLGGLVGSDYTPQALSATAGLLIGDRMCTNSIDQVGVNMGNRADYDYIRRYLWILDDYIYKDAIHTYSEKVDVMKKNPKPETEADIPEFIELPGGEFIQESCIDITLDRKEMESVCNELSAIYLDYPTLYGTSVQLGIEYSDVYRMNSQGLKVRMPNAVSSIRTSASVRAKDGSIISEYYDVPFDCRSYDRAKLAADVKEFAEALVLKSNAETTDDFYLGPLLLEGNSVFGPFQSVTNSLSLAKNTWNYETLQRGGNSQKALTGGMLLGKKFLDEKIDIHFYSDMESYDGIKLNGSYKTDFDGLKPEHDFVFVENGILKNLISGRYPGMGAKGPSGHSMIGNAYMAVPEVRAVTTHIKFDGAKPASKVKAQLISEARKAGLDYAYILSSISYNCQLLKRVDVKTGKETVINAITPSFGRQQLMHVISASKEENVGKFQKNTAVIAPKDVLLESVEMNLKKPDKAQDFQLVNPALR